MFKHANQVFPGDKVRRQGDKTAAPDTGEILEADPDTQNLKVKWASGETTWVSSEDVIKE